MIRNLSLLIVLATLPPAFLSSSPQSTKLSGGDKIIRKMPALVSDVAVGGGGRYLVLHLPQLKKLAVFDVNEARLTSYIPLAEDKVWFAAGVNKVVVGLPSDW